MAKRLWDKGESVNTVMQELTVGTDPIVDLRLVCADCVGSAAHARMLNKVGLLNDEELKSLLAALSEIYAAGAVGAFKIPIELEDVHTAIEALLIERCGEAGRRIHTARSRNDQVLLATRLFLRGQTALFLDTLQDQFAAISTRFNELKDLEMPGYTHMQPAMPSSVGMWLHAYAEWNLELIKEGLNLLEIFDSNPLGSGAGFGSSLSIDRELVASLLKFSRVQRSFIDVNNSRGRFERKFAQWLVDIGSHAEKFACDFMLYTTKEYGFFSLPNELTTGSSIMPQKRNPDLVELLRGRVAKLRGVEAELSWLIAKLPSSFHREFQYSKEPLMRGIDEAGEILRMMMMTISSFTANPERLAACMHPELFATYDANRAVASGKPFRDAYRETAARVKEGDIDVSQGRDDFRVPQADTVKGMAAAVHEASQLNLKIENWHSRIDDVNERVFHL